MPPVRAPYRRRRRRPLPPGTTARRQAAGGDAAAATSGGGAGGHAALPHHDLLLLARAIQAAAVAEDEAGLALSVNRLRRLLRHHIKVERVQQGGLAPALRAVVFGGQDRLLRLADSMSHDAAGGGACSCLRRGAELVVAIRRQAALEAAALLRPGDAR
jgi:hypothetical protein